jgi:hypothetical protein
MHPDVASARGQETAWAPVISLCAAMLGVTVGLLGGEGVPLGYELESTNVTNS